MMLLGMVKNVLLRVKLSALNSRRFPYKDCHITRNDTAILSREAEGFSRSRFADLNMEMLRLNISFFTTTKFRQN
jgi:hypothetical protein